MLPALGFLRLHRFGKLDFGPAECQQLPELCFPPASGFTLPPDIVPDAGARGGVVPRGPAGAAAAAPTPGAGV